MEHFLKFLVVGTLGFIINTVGLLLGVRAGLRPSIAAPIGSEVAIISNFILNNFWTFSDKTITSTEDLIFKFLQFNVLSFASVIIQFVALRTGEAVFGMKKFKEPFINLPIFARFAFIKKIPMAKKFSLYFVFYVGSVGIGLIVNFTMYSLIIWR